MMTVATIMATMSLQAQTDIDLDSEAMYFDIAAARAEYAEKSGQTTDAPAMKAIQHSSARIYRIDGTPASNNTHDIIIEDGQKRIRPYQR